MSAALHLRIVRIEGLIAQMKAASDPETRAASLELVQTMMEFHNVGLDRMMEIVASNAAAASAIQEQFAEDPTVSSMLLLHDLHPVDMETRVATALETIRPYLRSRGGNVELIDVNDRIVRVQLVGNSDAMRDAIEKAIHDAAPDAVSIETT